MTLISESNLKLAWRRITTGVNHQYKSFFRRLYYAYEVALDDNIKDLYARLRGGAYKLSPPLRVYVPKPSGLQRPLTLLLLEDQIILQAMANVFSEKLKSRRKPLELKSVFSNVLETKKESIFFVKNWHFTYGIFQHRIEEYYRGGMRWIAHFDLAAFYDTISHDLLLQTLYPRGGGQDVRSSVSEWLRSWSAERRLLTYGHGIPQGPIASDFLAECFLLPIDEALAREGYPYVRYVDDIRVFGANETAVRKAAIRLEILCRNRGLIPQGKKFGIYRARSLGDAMGGLPSIPPPGEEEAERFLLPAGKAIREFQKALKGKPHRIVDNSRARYVLYRAEPSSRLLAYVLRMLPRHPEHIDAFVHYLAHYEKSKPIIRACTECLLSTPYEYVQGAMWHILARMLAKEQMKDFIQEAITIVKSRDACVALKWGALHFLCIADAAGHGKYANFLRYQEPLLQALLASVIPERCYRGDAIIKGILKRTAFEPGIMLAEEFVRRGMDHHTFVPNEKDLVSQVRNIFRAVGLIKRVGGPVDPIGEIIACRYIVRVWTGWRPLLGRDYMHAQQILCQAEPVFDSGRSVWLSHQNSFNDAVFVAMQRHLNSRGLAGAMRIMGRDGKRVSFGVLLAAGAQFDKAFPVIADAFRTVNSRRNSVPASHPYESSGTRTRFLTKKERNQLVAKLRKGYQEIINVFDGIVSTA